MKVKMKAIAIFTWEEDTENWTEEDPPPKTKEELIDFVREYVEQDYSYVLDHEPDSIDIELEK